MSEAQNPSVLDSEGQSIALQLYEDKKPILKSLQTISPATGVFKERKRGVEEEQTAVISHGLR